MVNTLVEDPVTAVTGLVVPVAGLVCWKIFDVKYKKENQKIYVESLDNAIKEVCGNNQKNTVTFVVGSFYIYGNVIKNIEKQ